MSVPQADEGSATSGVPGWLGPTVESVILIACVVYLTTSDLWALMTWELIALIYIGFGLTVIWRGAPPPATNDEEIRLAARLMWIPPVVAAAAGGHSAVVALVTQRHHPNSGMSVLLMSAAAVGIILSWTLLQIGFAEMYRIIDATGDSPGLAFPSTVHLSTLNYLYFAFTVGTSFATSDVNVTSLRTRRVVLVHSVVSFFYNALVVAVAFQMLQDLVAR